MAEVMPASAVDVANAAIRAHCAGRTDWSPEALARLDELRRAWFAAREAEAVRRHMAVAA